MAVKAKSSAAAMPRGTKMTIALPGNPFPIEIGVKAAVLVKSGTGRLVGKTVCQEHLSTVKTHVFCEEHGEELVTGDTVSAYDVGGRFVAVDKSVLGAAKDDRLELKALVEAGAIDPLYFERPYGLFAQEGQDASFALLAAALRESGKWAVGTAVLNKSTKAVVLRWSQDADCLLMHACTYDARVEWDSVGLIVAAAAASPQLEGAQAEEAATLIGAMLSEEFDFGSVVDEYGVELEQAVDAASQGLEPIVKPKLAPVEPVADLMAALRGQVTAAKEKAPAKKPAAKKVAA